MNVSELLGQTLKSVKTNGKPGDEIDFVTMDGDRYRMYHDQGCCESVSIEDIIGDLEDLVGSPILMAEEAENRTNPEGVVKDYQDSFTWTFYKFATIKGYVTIRWYGESNGYYSESVNFKKLPSKKLVQKGWHDDGQSDSLIYFQIIDDKKIIWESSWYDARDLYDGEEVELRNEITTELAKHGLGTDFIEGHWSDWGCK